MKEVSCRALGPILEGLEAKGIPLEKLVNGLPTTIDALREPKGRLDWDLVVRILERLEELLGSTEALIELGRDNLQSVSSFGFMRKVAAVFVRPRDLYWMGTNWFGRSLFTNVEGSFEDLPDGRVRETLQIADGYRDCPQLFYILCGALSATPRLLRRPDSGVRMAVRARQAVYTITPPPPARLRSRPLAILKSRYASWELIDTMSREQQELNRNIAEMNEELSDAVGMLEDLRKATVIGREVATHVDRAEFAQSLEKALSQHVPNRGVALWLQQLSGTTTNLLCTHLEGDDAPTRIYHLSNGSRHVGRLEIWDRYRQTEADILDEMIPWIALGLDNMRANTAIGNGTERR